MFIVPLLEMSWVKRAIYQIEADFRRSSDTHLIRVNLPVLKHVTLYLKDESTHPSGSLKHRLARSLFLYGLCNGQIEEGTTIVEASSGNTAVSEAYFARLLGLPFVAVVPEGTSHEKIEAIRFYGGDCQIVAANEIYSEAERLAVESGGYFMDQFANAERVTDWRGNNNIANSIFEQMGAEPSPQPDWIVVSAGTGGTSASIGRFIRYQGLATRLCVADPTFSVFYDFFQSGEVGMTIDRSSRIEGIGRPRVEPSFISTVIDRMIKVPDEASLATLGFLEMVLNRKCGGSTGTNVFAALQLASELEVLGETASVVTLICDGGERYLDTYYSESWIKEQNLDLSGVREQLAEFSETGRLSPG